MLAPFLLAVVGPAAAQTTWFVDAAGSPPGSGTRADPFTSIQYGIERPATVDGDTLLVAAGLYRERLDLSGKTLTLRGDGPPGAVVVTAGASGRVLAVGSYFPGPTFTTSHGGGAAAAELRRCVIRGNTATIDPLFWAPFRSTRPTVPAAGPGATAARRSPRAACCPDCAPTDPSISAVRTICASSRTACPSARPPPSRTACGSSFVPESGCEPLYS